MKEEPQVNTTVIYALVDTIVLNKQLFLFHVQLNIIAQKELMNIFSV